MMNLTESDPLTYILVGATLIAGITLVLPFIPIHGSVVAFIGACLIGGSGYIVLTIAANTLYDKADQKLPEEPPKYPNQPVDDEVVEAYLDGEISEAEYENEVEKELINK